MPSKAMPPGIDLDAIIKINNILFVKKYYEHQLVYVIFMRDIDESAISPVRSELRKFRAGD